MTLALENHGGITATPDQILSWSKAIDAPNFGVNLDTGNFHTEDPYADLASWPPTRSTCRSRPRSTARQDREEADLARLVGILRDARYSGYVVLEYEAEEDPMKAIPRHIKELTRADHRIRSGA